MNIHLPRELESSIQAAVLRGQFANEDEAVALILRDYFRRQVSERAPSAGIPDANGVLGSIGSMRDAADELDQIVADTYRLRSQEKWRDLSLE